MNRRLHHSIALLSAALALQAVADVQLVPAGEFAGWDGRPGNGLKWRLSDAQGSALAAMLNNRHQSMGFNFDYEHQLLLAPENGQPAPAAGWANKFEWRPGQGLYALNVQWTARAKGMVEADEYRYLSPAIVYDEKTGVVSDVLNASLVNRPALAELASVVQPRLAALSATLFSTPENDDMQLLAALCAALGLAADTTEANALAAVHAIKVKADAKPSLPTALSAALGIDAAADEAVAVTAIAALKAGAATGNQTTVTAMTALQSQVAALSAQVLERDVTAEVDAALAVGKLLPAQREWATTLGKQSLVQLRAFIKDAPVVAAGLGGQQSKGAGAQQKAVDDPNAPLTTEELAMCSHMGLTEEQFRAGKKLAAA